MKKQIVLAIAASTLTSPLLAQDTDPVRAHLGHVAESFRGTPDGMGLLPAAVAEAQIAQQHATLAGRDPADLDAMKRHTRHVVNALDPAQEEGGPGLGYGVIPAARGTAQHIGLAAGSEGASDNVQTHARHVATAASNAAANAEAAMELAAQIDDAEEASEAAELVEELARFTTAIVEGVDANEDGRIGWQEGEGGLAQATQHLGLLMDGEGLGR